MPDCGSHEGTYDDRQYQESTIAYLGVSYSLRAWLEAFAANPARVDVQQWLIDGKVDPLGKLMFTVLPCPH